MMTGFGPRLEAALKRRDCSRVELAAALGTERSTIDHYISGRTEPRSERLRAICVELGESSDVLLGLAPAPPAPAKEDSAGE